MAEDDKMIEREKGRGGGWGGVRGTVDLHTSCLICLFTLLQWIFKHVLLCRQVMKLVKGSFVSACSHYFRLHTLVITQLIAVLLSQSS